MNQAKNLQKQALYDLESFNPFKKNILSYRINAAIERHQGKIYSTYRSEHLYGYNSNSYLVELNEDLQVTWWKRIKPSNNNPAFEDIRLLSIDNLLLAVYTYLPFHDGHWKWEFGVGFGIMDVEKGIIKHQISLRQLSNHKQSKNWVPYTFDNELFVITDFMPQVRIIKLADKTGKLIFREMKTLPLKTAEWKFGQIRGGTPLIPRPGADDGCLYGFVHSHLPDYNGYSRYYFYTVVRLHGPTRKLEYHDRILGEANDELTDDFKVLWTRSTNGRLKVIFPMGIINHKSGVVVSFGVDDISSKTKFFEWDHLISLFKQTTL